MSKAHQTTALSGPALILDLICLSRDVAQIRPIRNVVLVGDGRQPAPDPVQLEEDARLPGVVSVIAVRHVRPGRRARPCHQYTRTKSDTTYTHDQ